MMTMSSSSRATLLRPLLLLRTKSSRRQSSSLSLRRSRSLVVSAIDERKQEQQQHRQSLWRGFSYAPRRGNAANDNIGSSEKDVLDEKTGRGWTDPWDLEEMLSQKTEYDDLPDWSPELVSRISSDRIQLLPSDRSIPTLATLATMALPPLPPPHPGSENEKIRKIYAKHRKRAQFQYVQKRVRKLAEPLIAPIQKLTTWEEKQDAVDDLYERVEFQLQQQEDVLGKHPDFGIWVERALEEYLRSIQNKNSEDEQPTLDSKEGTSSSNNNNNADVDEASPVFPTAEEDEAAVPVFMDCFDPAKDSDKSQDDVVPAILHPLAGAPSPRVTVGRMVEEWELSAHRTSRRIMLRQSTRQIARALVEAAAGSPATASRVYVHGGKGTGKSAALASIVASARISGAIVLYLPDGDQLHQNGFYIEPNPRRKGVFDLPVLSQNVCRQLLDSHEKDLAQLPVGGDPATMARFFTKDQLEKMDSVMEGGSTPLVKLLRTGADTVSLAGPCFAAAVHVLMHQQESTPFVIVMDEYNCYHTERGHYFHEVYDPNVRRSVPYRQISLFQPAMDAMNLLAANTTGGASGGDSDSNNKNDDGEDFTTPPLEPVLMKRGAVVVGTTESHAISRDLTAALTANAKLQAVAESEEQNTAAAAKMHVVEVPRLSPLEVEHMLANYEATGVGKLRLDQGDTVGNQQEVAFLRLVSGSVPQKLLDACIM